MLSPSAWPTASSTRSSYSSSCELDASKLMVDCSFPELLARDLTTSENIFTSKAMTAGCPFAGLAAPDSVTSASFQRPLLPSRAGHQQQPPGVDKSLLHPFVIDEEEGLYVEDLDGDERFGMKDTFLDSSNVHSTGMVPHLTLTRQQSVATAATSDSGRCSSVFSHNAHSPTFPVLSSCSSNRGGSSHGTWYEDDPGSPQNGPASSVFTARTSISDPRQPALDLGNYDDMIEPPTPTDDQKGLALATTEVHSPGSFHGTRSRPSTPIRQPHPEKARIVDIPPLSTGLKRTSSRKWDRQRPGSPSVASLSWEMTVPVGVTEEHRQGERIPGNTRPSVPMLETANGRTVIDASAPPPIAFASRDQALHRFNARPLSSMAIDENEVFEDGEEPSAMAYAKELTKAKKPSLPDLRRWVEATTETFASSQKSTSYTPSAPGIPLPPEVIESLRVSIACFPETMLLTSSLSIETIRAYSKKVKNRADLDRHLGNPDGDPVYSRLSQNLKPSKRWNMSWLGQSRRSTKHHPEPPQAYSLPRNTHPPPSFNNMSNLSLSLTTPTPAPWTPLKNIFPSATDRLCDALYAHLLAYNYLTSLLPTQQQPNPNRPPSSTHGLTTTATTTTPRRDLSIPHKAATLLGMDDPVSAAASTYSKPSPSPSRRGVLSRGRRDKFPLNDLFGTSAPTANGGGGGYGLSRSGTVGSSRSGTGYGESGAALLAGLGRWEGGDAGWGVILENGEGSVEGVDGLDPVLMRAICEVVRCAEEGCEGV
ncbi:hypothetical protein F5144DRAFT_654509 [Chaetomium tenue]|uniref:Uncharacterized protein n=1 Tax=Chaetomium tenue TaxID=1854479 RepID=A0ACB7P524_9PEZI|nr:hypothetical protein F5144DRAFT_654509 [Chaetomium globosum]